MSPSDRMAQLYPQAPGSLFVALYGPVEILVTSVHTGINEKLLEHITTPNSFGYNIIL
jgi:hypothetical protein